MLCSEINGYTYIGCTINFNRRIKQHNGIISGGAKRTRKHRPWKPIVIVHGFDKIGAMQFEWRWKRGRKITGRINLMYNMFFLKIWTRNARPCSEYTLIVEWFDETYIRKYIVLPNNITYKKNINKILQEE